MHKLLRIGDVLGRTGLKRSFLYSEIKRGKFPEPIKVSPRVALWPEAEISAWQACAISQADDESIRQTVNKMVEARKTSRARV